MKPLCGSGQQLRENSLPVNFSLSSRYTQHSHVERFISGSHLSSLSIHIRDTSLPTSATLLRQAQTFLYRAGPRSDLILYPPIFLYNSPHVCRDCIAFYPCFSCYFPLFPQPWLYHKTLTLLTLCKNRYRAKLSCLYKGRRAPERTVTFIQHPRILGFSVA